MEQLWELANRFPMITLTIGAFAWEGLIVLPAQIIFRRIRVALGLPPELEVTPTPRVLRPFAPWNPKPVTPSPRDISTAVSRRGLGEFGLHLARENAWITDEKLDQLRTRAEASRRSPKSTDELILMRIVVKRSLRAWHRVRGMRSLLEGFAVTLGIEDEWARITADTGTRDNSTELRRCLRAWLRAN